MANPAKASFQISGVDDLKAAFREMPKATQRAVLRRILTRPANRIAEGMRSKVSVFQGHLKRSIKVMYSSDAAAAGKRAFAEVMSAGGSRGDAREAARAAAAAEGGNFTVLIGPGRDPAAHMEEFGSVHNKPHPFARPAWDAEKDKLIPAISDDLWTEIEKTARRRARRAAR